MIKDPLRASMITSTSEAIVVSRVGWGSAIHPTAPLMVAITVLLQRSYRLAKRTAMTWV